MILKADFYTHDKIDFVNILFIWEKSIYKTGSAPTAMDSNPHSSVPLRILKKPKIRNNFFVKLHFSKLFFSMLTWFTCKINVYKINW